MNRNPDLDTRNTSSYQLPFSCSGEEIEIGAGGYVLSSSEIICNDSSFRVSKSGQVYEKK